MFYFRFFYPITATFILTAASLFSAPRAVVFDFGGVLTSGHNRQIVINFIQDSLRLSEAEFKIANEDKHLALKEGKTDEEFWVSFAEEKKIKLPAGWSQSLKSATKESVGVNLQMYALVDRLKDKKIQIGLLSNIDKHLAALIRDFGLYQPFDPCLLSYEIGVKKPDPKAFEILLRNLNLPPNEIVFIDDNIENVEVAKSMGIDAIHFLSITLLEQDLLKRGILESSKEMRSP